MIVNLELKIPHQSDLIQEMILVKQLFQRKQFKPAWTHFLKKWKWNLLEFTSDSTLNLFCYGHYFFSYNDVIENILISNVWLNKKKKKMQGTSIYTVSLPLNMICDTNLVDFEQIKFYKLKREKLLILFFCCLLFICLIYLSLLNLYFYTIRYLSSK